MLLGQPFFGMGIALVDSAYFFAYLHIRAVAAGGKFLAPRALTDGTYAVAEVRFDPVHPAALAVNHIGCDGCVVHLAPCIGGFLPQNVIVCHCGDIGIAGFTVQPTVCNHVLHCYVPPIFFVSNTFSDRDSPPRISPKTVM